MVKWSQRKREIGQEIADSIKDSYDRRDEKGMFRSIFVDDMPFPIWRP